MKQQLHSSNLSETIITLPPKKLQINMEEQEKSERNVKRHLVSLNRRIQQKYMEMQKKLEKSRSVDSLSNLSDDCSVNDFAYGSLDDLRETDEVFINEMEVATQSTVVEDVHKHNAVSCDLKSEATVTLVEDNRESGDWEKLDYESVDSRVNVSLDSLTEEHKIDNDISKPAPPPRTIKARFLAARERRREEREKQMEKKRNLILSNTKQDAVPESKPIEKKKERKNKQATVTVAFIDISGLEALTDGKERMLMCRYRLGAEKGKTRVVRSSDSVVKWQDLYNINMFEDEMLELSCFDNKTFLGRHLIDLSELSKDETHKLKLDLQEGETPGLKLFVLVTITGIPLLNSLLELDDFDKAQKRMAKAESQHEVVGSLSVIVYGAKGLSSQDCYCVVKLTNERLMTHTGYKTNDPNWMKIFTFHVTDITSILEVTIVDEKKHEDIAKISIPLLSIYDGEKVWYALKDSTQIGRAKGNNPRILLEMRTSWNLLKASIRVINPKEVDYLETSPKLDRRVFARNLARSKAVANWTLDTLKLLKTCFEWESRKSNAIALMTWIVFCYFFKIWMLPLLFLIPFLRHRPEKYRLLNLWSWWKPKPKSTGVVVKEKEEKSTLRQKINSLTEMVASVQNGIGRVASLGESVKNLVNFTVPYVSLLAVFLILCIAFIMYIVPLKYILICWGIHKFTRKILRPNRIPNSEILDLLSRVPDDETLYYCEELPLLPTDDDDTT